MDTLVRDLEAELAEIAGHLNVQHAHAVAVLAEAIEHDEWKDHGIHSPEHWARLRLGVNEAQARQLCKIARRWGDFPETMAEFTAGGLSVAQVDVIVSRAPTWADPRLAEFAQGLSVSQLRSTIRDEYFEHEPVPESDDDAAAAVSEPAAEPTATEPAEQQPVVMERPDHFGYEWRDGRLVVHGDFAADRGTAIEAILEHVRDQLFRATGQPASGADAFTELVTRAGAIEPGQLSSLDWGNGSRLGDVLGRVRTFLHLEVGDGGTRLAGHLSNGVRLPQAVCQYLTCDGSITPVWEHDHTPVGYGHDTRIVPTRLRRLIEHRDRGCRVPGCGSRHVEIHHIVHWADGGVTETWNLASLCSRHHRMHHQGLLGITGNPDQPDGLTFTDSFGNPIAASRPVKPDAPPPPPAHRFEPATIPHFSLRYFYGWTERGAITTRRMKEHLARHAEADDDPDKPRKPPVD